MQKEKITGSIFLIPSSLSEEGSSSIPEITYQAARQIDFFIVENERSARRFLRSIGYTKDFDQVKMIRVEEDSAFQLHEFLLKHLQNGKHIGIISEAGCPGIADPGSSVVQWAHQQGIKVVPLSGPSSIFMALMASGLNGQQFAFHGYLPVNTSERKKKLQQLVEESRRKRQTQIFMETPYRNDALLKDLLEVVQPTVFLCIASGITGPNEFIFTQTVAEWKKNVPDLKKKPTIFLMLAT